MTAFDIALSIALAVAAILIAGPLSLNHGLTPRRRSLLAQTTFAVPGVVLGIGILINPQAGLSEPLLLMTGALVGTITGSTYASVKTRRQRVANDAESPGLP